MAAPYFYLMGGPFFTPRMGTIEVKAALAVRCDQE